MLLIPNAGTNHLARGDLPLERLSKASDLAHINPTILIQERDPLCARLQRTINTAIESARNAANVAIQHQMATRDRLVLEGELAGIIVNNNNPKSRIDELLQVGPHPTDGSLAKEGDDHGMPTGISLPIHFRG